MFEKAARIKLRFATAKGLLPVEDLWALPLTSEDKVNLDFIAVDLHEQIDKEGSKSFVVKKKSTTEVLQLKFDIVKHMIDVRMAEDADKKLAADKKAQKDKLLEIIARKQDASLEEMSLPKLQKMVEAL